MKNKQTNKMSLSKALIFVNTALREQQPPADIDSTCDDYSVMLISNEYVFVCVRMLRREEKRNTTRLH